MGIEEIIDVTLSETAADETLASFDIPGILAKSTDTPGTAYASARAVRYNCNTVGLAQHSTDWGSASDTQDAAEIGASQTPKPTYFYTIKRGTPVAQVKTVTFSKDLVSGDTIEGVVNHQTVSVAFTSTHDDTIDALDSALAALVGVASATDDADKTVTVTAESEWNLDISLSVDGADPPTVTVAVDTAGRNVADDIDDALAEDETNKWYALCPVETNIGLILAAAAKIETTEKVLVFQTNEAGVKDSTDTTNVAVWLKALNYRRSIGCYRHVTTDYWNVAAAFDWLANSPGSNQMANTELVGVVGSKTSQLTTAEAAIVEGRGLNTYRQFTSSTSLIRQGIRADGNPADATRDLDAARNKAREIIFSWFSASKKPSGSEDGIIEYRGKLQEVVEYITDNGIARTDMPITITPPTLSGRSFTGSKIAFTLDKGVIDAALEIEGGL